MTSTATIISDLQLEIENLKRELDTQGGVLELHKMYVDTLQKINESLIVRCTDTKTIVSQINDLMTLGGATLTERQEDVLYAALKAIFR